MINQIVCKPSMVLQTGSTINVTQQILYDCKIVEREQEEIKNEKIKKSQKIKQEKEDARQLKEHWGEIASAKELQLTDEDIQTLKDFMKDL